MRRIIFTLILALSFSLANAQDATYLYSQKDGENLYIDCYFPADGSQTEINGIQKPSIIYMFGGGFKINNRTHPEYTPWFKVLTKNGYRVFVIDYRLGLANSTKAGVGQVKEIYRAVEMAVEDLFSATTYIVENAAQLGVDPKSIVISGSSSGGITALQADWALSNGEAAGQLPEGFRYAGVMSFAGAILSNRGTIKYKQTPSPTLMLHGTEDKVVNYNKLWFFNWRFCGTHALSRIFTKNGYNYNILRYIGHNHDIEGALIPTLPEQLRFLETNVMKKVNRKVDALLDDESVPINQRMFKNRKELYGG